MYIQYFGQCRYNNMNNIDIVKKRLTDLKYLSQSLRKNSEQREGEQQNVNIVKAILHLTKNVSSKETNNQPGILDQLWKNIQLTKQEKSQFKQNRNAVQNNFQTQQRRDERQQHSNERQLIEGKLTRIQSKSYQQQQSLKQQVIDNKFKNTSRKGSLINQLNQKEQQYIKSIIQQNKRLGQEIFQKNQKITNLQSQLQIMQNRQSNEVDFDSNSHIQHYKYDLPTYLFYTKLEIAQKDYKNIQYSVRELKLSLNYIQIQQFTTGNRKSRGSKEYPQAAGKKQKVFAKIYLSDLIAVEYIPEHNILMKFKDEGNQLKYLYIKFEDYDHMRKWDLAIYVNYLIVRALKMEKIFNESNSFLISERQAHTQTTKYKQNENQFTKEQQNSINLAVVEKYQKLIKVDKLNKKQQNLLKKYLQLQDQISQLQKRMNGQNMQSYILNVGKNNQQGIANKNQQEQDKSRQKQEQNEIKLRLQLKEKEEQIQALKRWQQQRDKIQKIQKQKEAEKMLKISQNKSFLKKGLYMTKYAEGAFNPHEKRVFLSADEKKLCWQQKNEKSFKSIQIEDIVSVRVGEIGPGILKHIERKNIENINRFILIKLKNKNREQLQFGINDEQLMAKFAQMLQTVMDHPSNPDIKF